MKNKNFVLGLILVLLAGMFFGYSVNPMRMDGEHLAMMEQGEHLEMMKEQTISEQRTDWMAMADNIRGQLAITGKYDCCLDDPCWYCIQKTPGHGEGAECTCRQDILDGKHPCGECIGEILEGHGLAKLKPLYAKAIAHKVGEEHLDHLQDIIDDMY